MNFKLSHIPARTTKPREDGVTMVMDKGLSLRQAEDLISVSGDLVDLVKIGFGTSVVTPRLTEKIKLYQKRRYPKVYLGGTSSKPSWHEDSSRIIASWWTSWDWTRWR
jgi:phosphosulfolactate synthase